VRRGYGRLTLAALAAVAAAATAASCSFRAGDAGLELAITAQEGGKRLLAVGAAAGDELVFEWIHSVELFPWFEYFDVAPDGALILRETRIAGFGAGVPYERGTSVRIEDGFIVYGGIDESFPSYRWINSATAFASVSLNGKTVARGADLPHHEALELRVAPRR